MYRLGREGTLTLLTDELSAPNGLAFAPDGRTLYVSNADRTRLVWMAFPVRPDGTLGKGRTLYDGTQSPGRTAAGPPTASRWTQRGTSSGRDREGSTSSRRTARSLGWLDFGGNVGNVAWGEDGGTLFIAANAAVYRLRLSTRGAGWPQVRATR